MDAAIAVGGRGGGGNNLANCPQPGVGYVASRPDFDLTLTDNSARRDLVIRVNASCDTVLLVNGATGLWNFNDDSDGFNPRLQLPDAQAGVYDIWVGTYSPTPCQATLTLEMLGGTQMSPAQNQWDPSCPHPGRSGDLLSYDAGQLVRAQRFDVIAGGDTDLGNCASVPGHGHIIQSPDFTLNLTGNAQGHDLQLRVEAGCDPVLLVNDPAGQWHFNDDADGLNSRLRLFRAQPGSYDIWAGTFGSQNCHATLIAEALGGQPVPQPQPQPVVPQPPMTSGGGLTWRFDRDTQGWMVRDGQLATVPGSHMQVTAWEDSRVGYLIAPPSALGDWRGVTAIEAVMRAPGSRYFAAFSEGAVGDLVIRNGAMTAAAAFPHWLGTDWAHVTVPLREAVTLGGTPLWQLGGGARSLDQVLANVTGFEVRGEFRLGDTTADVREITLQGVIGSAVPPRDPLPAAGTARFVLVETGYRITFDEAHREAESLGGHLATITSEAEMAAVRAIVAGRDVFANTAGPWLGGVRVNNQGTAAEGWTWISGEPWSYTAWARNEPNYFRAAELTGLNLTDRDGIAWDDNAPYAPITAFVVEFPGVPLAGVGPVSGSVGGQVGALPAAAGTWRINGNNYAGTLTLTWSGAGWAGVVNYDVYRRDEPLENIRFDPASGSIEFTRPIPGATQIYRGRLTGGEMRGEFNQASGAYSYGWSATLNAPQAGGGTAPGQPMQSAAGLLRILSATYGGNCGVPVGNVTDHIAAQCNRQGSCTYVVDYRVIGDPAVGCMKDYVVNYECGDGQTRTASVAPEAGGRRPVTLECPAQTDAPPATGGAIK